MVRNAGKFGKAKRGGGRNFSRDLVLDNDGIAESKASRRKNVEGDDDDDAVEEEDEEEEEEGEEEEEEEEEEDAAEPNGPAQPELTRTERRELKKKLVAQKQAQKRGVNEEDDEDADLINPNHVERKLNISDLGSIQPTRKEREAKEKQEAKERYWKLQAAGKTEEARSDLTRLKKIREERETAQAKRKAEAEARAAEMEAKKNASRNGKRI